MYRVAVRNLTKILIRVYEHRVEIRDTAIVQMDAAAFYAPYIPLTSTGILQKAGIQKTGTLNVTKAGSKTLPGGANLTYPSSQIYPMRVSTHRRPADILAQLREMVEWCESRHGPSAVGTEPLPGRLRHFDPNANWGLGHATGKDAVFYFRNANAAFEFKMRWG